MKKLTEKQIDLLENGPKSLSQAWALQAMKNEWIQMSRQFKN
jgi:hypothetical protein